MVPEIVSRYTQTSPYFERRILIRSVFSFISTFLVLVALAVPLVRAADTPDQRKAALAAVLHDYSEDQLKHDPEMASALGDKRYDDQLSDYSALGYNASLDRGRAFLDRLGAIDTGGFSDAEKHSKDALVNLLVEQEADAISKPWETPITDKSGLPFALPLLVQELRFDSQADYDHYIDRLKKVPTAFEQITTDLMSGIDDHQGLGKDVIDQMIAQMNAVATQKPEDSVFAQPLKHLPPGISATEQASDKDSILSAITRQVLPAYARLAKFLKSQYAPQGNAATHSYMARQQVVINMRAKADATLGPKLDLKAFGDAVFAADTLPADKLAQSLADWIALQQSTVK